jgi:PPP family 3-phenylpropionic acid transporter
MSQGIRLRRPEAGFPMLQFFSWASMSCFTPYIVIVMTDRGLDNTRIGLILTLNALVTIVAQPFWGMISDRIQSIRKVYILCLALAAACYCFLPWSRTLGHLILLYPGVLFFLSPMAPLLDTWSYQAIRNRAGGSYGLIRLWAVVMPLVGRLVSLTGLNVISWLFALLIAASILVSLLLPQATPERPLNILHRQKLPVGSLFKSYPYVSFVVVLGLMFVSIQPMFGFQGRLMLDVGGTQELFGWAMTVAALSEIPVFIYSRRLISRFSPVSLVIVSFLFFAARLYAFSVASAPWMVMLVALLHGLSFALFLVGTVNYIDALAPAGLKSTALTIASAVYTGLSGIAGNALAGRLMDQYGIRPVYRLGSLATLTVLVLFLISLGIGRYLTRRLADQPVDPSA